MKFLVSAKMHPAASACLVSPGASLSALGAEREQGS